MHDLTNVLNVRRPSIEPIYSQDTKSRMANQAEGDPTGLLMGKSELLLHVPLASWQRQNAMMRSLVQDVSGRV
jgi:hypothetical protein